MIDKEAAISIATKRLQIIYPEPKLLNASHQESLEEFDVGVSGWRIWFQVKDPDFGDYDRPVEVSDSTEEARLVKILL